MRRPTVPGHAVRSRGHLEIRGLRSDLPGFSGRRHPAGARLSASRPEFAARRGSQSGRAVVMAVRPYIRTVRFERYWHQLASNEICLAISWSSDYSVAQMRAREDGTGAHLAFTLPKEGSNITYNAISDSGLCPASRGGTQVPQFHLGPQGHRRDHQRHPLRQRQSRAHGPTSQRASWRTRPCTPPPGVRARLYLPAELGADYDRLRTRVWTRIKTGQ